jgi:hypothetical protein
MVLSISHALLLVLSPLLWISNHETMVWALENKSEVKRNDGPFVVVPSFTREELETGVRNNELMETLRTTGLLSIKTQQQQQQKSRRHPYQSVAMNGLCHCLNKDHHDHPFWISSSNVEGVDSAVLDDDTTERTTIATATVGKSPLPLSSRDVLETACGTETINAMEVLRDQVALASETFVQTLDKLLQSTSRSQHVPPLLRDSRGGSYNTLDAVVQAANHLEHFHYYYHKDTIDEAVRPMDGKSKKALEWHTDAGLFLAFVPAWDCPSSGRVKDDSFWVQLPDGREVRALLDDESIVIMMGAGAEHWLKTSSSSLELRATRHAVDMAKGDARTWYGMSK